MHVLTRIGPWSLGRLLGVIYAVLGLVLGFFFSLITIFGASLSRQGGAGGPYLGMLFGGAAFVIFPILYGGLGLLGGALVGLIYNVASKWIGGLELELTQR